MRLEDEIAETYMENYDYLPPVEAVQAVAQDVGADEEEVAKVLKNRIGLDFSRTKFEDVGKYSSIKKHSSGEWTAKIYFGGLSQTEPPITKDFRSLGEAEGWVRDEFKSPSRPAPYDNAVIKGLGGETYVLEPKGKDGPLEMRKTSSKKLKNQLIKLGSKKPELQKHLRPVIDKVSADARVADIEVEIKQMERKVYFEAVVPGWEAANDLTDEFYRSVDGFEEIDVKEKGVSGTILVRGKVEPRRLPDYKRKSIAKDLKKVVKSVARSHDMSFEFGKFDTSGNLNPS